MLDLIWLLGGGCGGAAGAGGWVGLGVWCWMDGAVDAGDGGVLEVEGPPSEDSFCPACGCFLGMVKVLLVTRSAPEA